LTTPARRRKLTGCIRRLTVSSTSIFPPFAAATAAALGRFFKALFLEEFLSCGRKIECLTAFTADHHFVGL